MLELVTLAKLSSSLVSSKTEFALKLIIATNRPMPIPRLQMMQKDDVAAEEDNRNWSKRNV